MLLKGENGQMLMVCWNDVKGVQATRLWLDEFAQDSHAAEGALAGGKISLEYCR